jgi:hypothetical protein
MFDDWEEDLDKEVDVVDKGNVAFEGEDLKVEKKPEQEVKEVTEEERKRHADAAEAKKKSKKKKYEEDQPAEELTVDERKKIEEQARKNDMKMAADLLGNDSGNSILDIKLDNEQDYISFAKVITTKVEKAKIKKHIVEFLGKMFKELEPIFGSKEYGDVQAKITPLLNASLQKEKGKDGKKKKSKGPSLQMNKSQRENTELYEGYAMDDGGNKASGGNIDGGRYDDDDDFM